jgi:prepilin-type N-terminal cleavage/methylation domain-containing protein
MIKDQRGFGLVEILVAILILGFVFAVFGSVFGISIQTIGGAGKHHAALTAAQSLLERALWDGSLGEADGVYRDSSGLSPNGHEGVLITVRLPWRTGFGSERVVELSTFRANPKE